MSDNKVEPETRTPSEIIEALRWAHDMMAWRPSDVSESDMETMQLPIPLVTIAPLSTGRYIKITVSEADVTDMPPTE